MLTVSLIVVSVILGYLLAVALSMVTTFAVARQWPGFAVRDHRMRNQYLLFQDAVWLVSGAVAGYAASLLVADSMPWAAAALLAVMVIAAMWRNTEEVMQRGLIHMLLASACIVAGVGAGFALHLRQRG
jgi:predicted histidine transporter YuiF (NhaC family)